ncbi:MAG TPA: hypothetical protein PKH58_00345 [Paludibacteraceae bacterium]|nr:hypothetical protein [Paludibacteraceae bacterium]HPT43482.1 hypothetical protein [Paludibacteraceae bacterium]
MKNKINLRYIYNPFEKIAGWQALLYGLVFVVLSGWIGKHAGLVFDGAIDAHLSNDVTYYQALIILVIDVVCMSIVMYVAGLFVTKNFRFIDLLGTMTLARAPYIVLSLAGLFVTVPETADLLANPYRVFTNPGFLVFIVLTIPVMVWVIALMYNAWKVSTGAKGPKMIVGFIAGLFVAEVISKILISIII